jgi:hypothetical protein
METSTWGTTLAIKNFFTSEECESIAFSGKVDGTTYKDQINKAIFEWNDRPDTKYKLDWAKLDISIVPCAEETVYKKKSVHMVHQGNITSPCVKVQAWLNLAGDDSFQGSEISIADWPGTPYQDNFGKWVGNPGMPSQPTWLNEQGTLIIAHASVEIGYGRTLNGSAPRLLVQVTGPAYK